MSTYLKKGKMLEYDNAPQWLESYMHYCRTIKGNTTNSVMTYFKDLRMFCQWAMAVKQNNHQPRSKSELQKIDITMLPLNVVLNLRQNDIENYLYFLTDVLGNSPSTRTKKLVSIRSFYDYVMDQQDSLGVKIEANPASRIRNPKQAKTLPVYLPEEDQIALLETISGENAERDYAVILIMLVTGIRVSELCNLDLSDMDLKAMTLKIREGKGSKSRIAYLTPPCCKALHTYMDQYRNIIPDLDTNALFVSKRYRQRITSRTVEKAMHKYTIAARLGGKGYTPHKLRHTTATTMVKGGENLLVVQTVMGHKSPTTTELYTHLNNEDISKAVNRSDLSRLGFNPLQVEDTSEVQEN